MIARRLRAVALAGLCAAQAALAGCGSSSPTSPPSATTTAATPGVSRAQATQPVAGLRSVAIIGDSLTFQDGNGSKAVTSSLVKAGWPAKGICFSGSDGRTIVDTLPGGAPSAQAEVKRCRAQLGEPQLWVIALVSNNLGESAASVRKDMATLLALLGPQARVMWVNTARQDLTTPDIVRLDPVVRQVVAARPNTRLCDWYGYLRTHPRQAGWWKADGGHMTATGYAQRNDFIAAQAREWLLEG